MIMTVTEAEIKAAVEMAEVKTGLLNIQTSVVQIQQTLQELVKIDVRIAQVTSQNQNLQDELITAWKKIDDINQWRVDVDKSLNRAHGARSIISIVVGFIQILALSIGSYVAIELVRTQRINDVQDSKIDYLESRIK